MSLWDIPSGEDFATLHMAQSKWREVSQLENGDVPGLFFVKVYERGYCGCSSHTCRDS